MQALRLASPGLVLLCWTLLDDAVDPRPRAGEHVKNVNHLLVI